MPVINVNKINKFGDYAHFPGTGPPGETCKSCAHCLCRPKTVKFICRKAAEMRGIRKFTKMRDIDVWIAACKYWESKDAGERQDDRAPTHEPQGSGMDGEYGDPDSPPFD